jgi:hypothetical protein
MALLLCLPTMFSSLALVILFQPTQATITLTAYGCDTPNVTQYPNFISAVPLAFLRDHKECTFARSDLNPLGTCFRTPAYVKAQLDLLPPGKRAISLEGTSLYVVESQPFVRAFQDNLTDGTTPSPWVDAWAQTVQQRFTSWFSNFSRIGGTVDIVLSDYEGGGKVYWYDFAKYPNGTQTAALLTRDQRWNSTRALLNAAAVQYVSKHGLFDNISDIHTWSGYGSKSTAAKDKDYRAWIWDKVLVDDLITTQLNRSVYAPIAFFFPTVRFSNFAQHYHTDSRNNNGAWWPWSADSAINVLGQGSHVGTHQSTSFYGGRPFQSYVPVLTSQSYDRVWETEPTPFNSVVQEAKLARDMVQAAPLVPIAPWFAPRDFTVSDPNKVANATSHLFGSDMWQEALIHVLLSTASCDVLWWKPGHMVPHSVGVPLLASTLNELQQVLNVLPVLDMINATTTMTPVVDVATEIGNWNVAYILSGVRVGRSTFVYRFTPRCLFDANHSAATAACTRGPDLPKNGTAATFHVASGKSITPVVNGTIWMPARESIAPLGFWIVGN